MFRCKRLALILLVLALVAAACGNDDSSDDEAAEEVTPTAEPTEEADEVEAASETPTPTEEPEEAVQPLTGLPLDDPSIMERPAIIVKIDNAPEARPQVGLLEADMVVEILVEGITRLAGVYHSEGSDPVGPTRSARSSDPNVASNFNRPLYAASGGNSTVLAQIAQAETEGKLFNLDVNRATADYFRDNSSGRFAPHNLFTSTEALWARQPDDAEPPFQIFEYRGPDDELPASAEEVPGVVIVYEGGYTAEHVWDPAAQGWVRWQQGTPHMDASGAQVGPANVVVLFTPYGASAADAISPEALTVGTGEAQIYTDGHRIDGSWERADPFQPWSVTDADGEPVQLTPGQTWILLPGGTVEVMTDARAEELLATRP